MFYCFLLAIFVPDEACGGQSNTRLHESVMYINQTRLIDHTVFKPLTMRRLIMCDGVVKHLTHCRRGFD